MKTAQEETKQLLIRMPKKLWKYLKKQSCSKEIPMNTIMVEWLQTRMSGQINKEKIKKLNAEKNLNQDKIM